MIAARVKALFVLALILLTVAGAHAWRPTARLADSRGKVDLESMFPRAFGDWVVDPQQPVQLVSPDTQAVLDRIYNQTLSRTYVNRVGERMMLSVAYGGDQSDATRAHRPEVCYPAQGFEVMSQLETELAMQGGQLRVRQLVARQGSRVEPLTYWVVVGERVTLSGTEQKLAQLSYTLRGVIPDGMLVRVSSIDANATKALAAQAQFISLLVQSAPTTLRPQIVGWLIRK